jgi:hypothetical protein
MDRADAGKLTGWVTSLAILLYLAVWLVVFKDYWPPQGVLRNVLFWGRCALGALALAAFNPLSWRLAPFSTLSRRLIIGATWIASEVVTLIFL